MNEIVATTPTDQELADQYRVARLEQNRLAVELGKLGYDISVFGNRVIMRTSLTEADIKIRKTVQQTIEL